MHSHLARLIMAGVAGLALVACGGGTNPGASNPPPASSTATTESIQAPVVTTELSLIAGDIGGPGNLDGRGTSARFSAPMGIGADKAGNLYVADTGNYTIRKVTPAGVVSTFAGKAGEFGSADGARAEARFYSPRGIAVDADDNVFVTDMVPFGSGWPSILVPPGSNYLPYSHSTIRKITPAGVVTTIAGVPGETGATDGVGAAARFQNIQDIAIDAGGNLYIADTGNAAVRKVAPGGIVTTLVGRTSGTLATAILGRENQMGGIAVDATGNLYVGADYAVHKIAPDGKITILAGMPGTSGQADGQGDAARFMSVDHIHIDRSGTLYVADSGAIRKVSPTGKVSTFAGAANETRWSADGDAATARFQSVGGITGDAEGNLYAADRGGAVKKLTSAGAVSTFAGRAHTVPAADGTAFTSLLSFAADTRGNMFVADFFNNAVYRITADHRASAVLDGWGPLALDGDANLYIGTAYGGWPPVSKLRKLTPAGDVSIIGSPITGRFITLASDAKGTLYSTIDPCYGQRDCFGGSEVRKLDQGLWARLAGGTWGMQPGPGFTDGAADIARFHSPSGLAADGNGNVFVADTYNHAIRKITPQGWVSTVAGSPVAGSRDGPGAQAQFNSPSAVAVDEAGNVYVADSGNHTIRRIDPNGIVSTIAGVAGQAGIVLGNSPNGLFAPAGIAVIGPNTLAVRSGSSVLKLVLN